MVEVKLTQITPQWELLPLETGWSGTARALKQDGLVTLRLRITRGDGAGSRPLNLPGGFWPGHRWVDMIYPTVGITRQSGYFIYGTEGTGLINMSTDTPVGVDFNGEFTYRG